MEERAVFVGQGIEAAVSVKFACAHLRNRTGSPWGDPADNGRCNVRASRRDYFGSRRRIGLRMAGNTSLGVKDRAKTVNRDVVKFLELSLAGRERGELSGIQTR